MDEFRCVDIGVSYLGASLLSIVDGWIYSVTCKYILLMLLMFYFVIYIGPGFSFISRANCCMDLLLKIVEFCLYYRIFQCMGHVMWTKSPTGNYINELTLISHLRCTSKYKRCKIVSPWPRRLAKWSWGLVDWESKILTHIHRRLHSPKTKALICQGVVT